MYMYVHVHVYVYLSLSSPQPSLVLLNVSGDFLDSLEDIIHLNHLTTLIATDNNLSSMKV